MNDQAQIPVLGLGTWNLNGEECVRAVTHALSVGYRHIDTADGYGNHREVGRFTPNPLAQSPNPNRRNSIEDALATGIEITNNQL